MISMSPHWGLSKETLFHTNQIKNVDDFKWMLTISSSTTPSGSDQNSLLQHKSNYGEVSKFIWEKTTSKPKNWESVLIGNNILWATKFKSLESM